MRDDTRSIARDLSPHLRQCLHEVARNSAILEADYVALMRLDLINQPLAIGLPPLTPLGHSVLRHILAKTPPRVVQAATAKDDAHHSSMW